MTDIQSADDFAAEVFGLTHHDAAGDTWLIDAIRERDAAVRAQALRDAAAIAARYVETHGYISAQTAGGNLVALEIERDIREMAREDREREERE